MKTSSTKVIRSDKLSVTGHSLPGRLRWPASYLPKRALRAPLYGPIKLLSWNNGRLCSVFYLEREHHKCVRVGRVTHATDAVRLVPVFRFLCDHALYNKPLVNIVTDHTDQVYLFYLVWWVITIQVITWSWDNQLVHSQFTSGKRKDCSTYIKDHILQQKMGRIRSN